MKLLFAIFLVLGSVTGCLAQKAETVKVERLTGLINATSEHITVMNFWATWCGPCIKELPLFEKLNASNPSVNVILVSLDLDLDPDPEKVYRFIERKGIQSKVLLLDERDPNSWIQQIDSDWSGALPSTLVINHKTGKRKFVEKELSNDELDQLINEIQ